MEAMEVMSKVDVPLVPVEAHLSEEVDSSDEESSIDCPWAEDDEPTHQKPDKTAQVVQKAMCHPVSKPFNNHCWQEVAM